MNMITAAVLDIAAKEIGVHEMGGNNRGARVEEYQRAAGGRPGEPWCAAFVSWAFIKATEAMGVPNPMAPRLGALSVWTHAPEACRSKTPTIGSIFVIDHGAGKGHVGLVESVTSDHVVTVEGNTNGDGGREGDGVMRRIRRYSDINVGYVDYGADGSQPVAEQDDIPTGPVEVA